MSRISQNDRAVGDDRLGRDAGEGVNNGDLFHFRLVIPFRVRYSASNQSKILDKY